MDGLKNDKIAKKKLQKKSEMINTVFGKKRGYVFKLGMAANLPVNETKIEPIVQEFQDIETQSQKSYGTACTPSYIYTKEDCSDSDEMELSVI